MQIEFKDLVAIAARIVQVEEDSSLKQENLRRIALMRGLPEQEEVILAYIDSLKTLPDWQQAISMVKQAMSAGNYRPS